MVMYFNHKKSSMNQMLYIKVDVCNLKSSFDSSLKVMVIGILRPLTPGKDFAYIEMKGNIYFCHG